MDTEELTRRVRLLEQKLTDGTLHIAPHLVDGFEDSLGKIRFDGAGEVVPESVDSRIRSMLTAVAYFHDREEWKEAVTLREIQEAYFVRLVHTFSEPYEAMVKAGATPYQFAEWFSSDDSRVKETIEVADEFVKEILQFWENIADPAWIHLEDEVSSKAVFSGELFPDGSENIASSTEIYFDTTVLPDPFIKIAPLLQFMEPNERSQEVLRLALQALQYRDLVLTDLPIPIVAILPDKHNSDEGYRDFIHSQAQMDAVRHASGLFGESFDEIDEVADYLNRFTDSKSLVRSLKKPDELVFSTDWPGDLSEHIDRTIAEHTGKIAGESAGAAVLMQLTGRFAQAHDSMQRSRDLRGTPVIRAETSWRWFNWMLRGNARRFDAQALEALHVSRALHGTVSKEMSWIGSVPAEALIAIRKADALDEIRSVLGEGLGELLQARPENFHRTGDRVFENLDSAFADHERKLEELRGKKWKFAGRDIGSFIVVGGVELAAAITGIPLY
ncbi:MAG: hypothetical protein VYC42_04265, partial [Pseudomonadota bacterium]|nr:hypothetical protein [Pseudomonadota bacterium]